MNSLKVITVAWFAVDKLTTGTSRDDFVPKIFSQFSSWQKQIYAPSFQVLHFIDILAAYSPFNVFQILGVYIYLILR